MERDLFERERLAALYSYRILDSGAEEAFDALTKLAANICETPVALISLLDARRQWFKSYYGLTPAQTPREISFCRNVVQDRQVLIVEDALQDPRFADREAPEQPSIRFYAGAPLINVGGHALGTLCVIDQRPRQLSHAQLDALVALSGQTVALFELRRKSIELESERVRLHWTIEAAPSGILMVGESGEIRLVNEQVERLFGYDRAELIGRSIDLLVPHKLRSAHAGHRTSFQKAPEGRDMGVGRDLFGLRKDGSEFPVEVRLNPIITDSEGKLVLASVVDITERKQAESRLRASLDEKETLLKEIHHRVKNNLQIVSSLLNLQCTSLRPEDSRAFLESETRIRAMGLIHEALYRSDSLSWIEFRDYAESLGRTLLSAYLKASDRIRLIVEMDRLPLDIDTAIPCGLMLNELITNAAIHAFPDNREGEIRIGLRWKSDEQLEFSVADNGVGLPPGLAIDTTTSLGLRLVRSLAEDQLNGSIRIVDGEGTTFEITFPARKERGKSAIA